MLNARSLTEARLYLKITGCEKCEPPPPAQKTAPSLNHAGAANVVRFGGTCSSCGAARELEFEIEEPDDAPIDGRPTAVSRTGKRSRIIDVGQWLTLSQLHIQESRTERDRAKARLINIQAARCLDEALKFYDDPDNDLPPADAFYCDASRRRFRESPQQFSRGRLVSEKSKLPVVYDEPST